MARIIKPQALVMGGKAYYTLSSYDPVSVEVHVMTVTDADVDLILDDLADQAGVTRESLRDSAWVKKNVPGVADYDDLRSRVRSEIEQMNEEEAEDEKARKCLEALAQRLGQAVPPEQVLSLQQALMQQLQMELAARGRSLDWYAAQMGGTREMLEEAFAREAQAVAEQEAALDAYARVKKLSVDESEYPALLGLDPTNAKQFIDQAKRQGHGDELRDGALRIKAQRAVVGEASCTYVRETPEEAAERLEQVRSRLEQSASPLAGGAGVGASPLGGGSVLQGGATGGSSPSAKKGKDKGFKLV